jgi:hypothetical protein
MSLFKFNGNNAWVCPANNKYDLSLKSVDKITDNDFSFIAKIKVNWGGLNKNQPYREGGIINKNGKHVGLSAFMFEHGDCFIKGSIWTNDGNSEDILNEIVIKVNDKDFDLNSEIDVAFSYDKKHNKIRLIVNNQVYEKIVKGNVIDYSNTWLWVGVSNGFKDCASEYQNFFYGDILFVSVYESYLNEEIILDIFNNHNVYYKHNPICVFDFKNQTLYKVFDKSMNGNNLMKWDDEYMLILHPH